MSTTTNLKSHARALEQQEQWSAALEIYEQLVQQHIPGEDLEVGLWNRIGDLQMRLGQPARAVEAYERAVEAYEEAGLHNNALALCGKILRISPGRSSIHLKLGMISARKGFAADARTHLQQYIELAIRGGQLEKALGTILETARSRIADAEVLQALVEQLRERGWADRLEIELRPECDRLRDEGLDEEADRARAVLDGEALPPASAGMAEPLVSELGAHSRARGREAELDEVEPDGDLTPAGGDSSAVASASDASGSGEIDAEAELLEINPLEGLQTTHVGSQDEDPGPGDQELEVDTAAIADFQAGAGAAAEDDEPFEDTGVDDLPLLTFEPERETPDLAPLEFAIDVPDDENSDTGAGIAAAADEEEDEDSEEAADEFDFEPLAEIDDVGDDDEEDDLPLLAPSAEAHPGPLGFDPSELEDEPEDAPEVEREDDVEGEPEAVEDDAGLVAAELRDAATTTPETTAPGPRDTAEPAAPEPPAAEQAEDEYIDLSSLIFEDDEPATTRFVVDAEEPSGDEDKDFAEMLARFRDQVAKNIEPDDDSSHYDLGVAFKEMGLFDEAISEFQTAMRAGANPLATMEMLGECFIEKGQHPVAWRILDQAVRLSGAADGEMVGVLYWKGRCEEALGRRDAASECYERVLSVDIRFRDAESRLTALRS